VPELNIDEAQQLWKNAAFQDFSRQLGPRISTSKNKNLIHSFLNQQEGSQDSLANVFENFPSSAKAKAFDLLDKYKLGFEAPLASPWESAAENNVFKTPDFSSTFLDSTEDKRLLSWLGIKDPQSSLKIVNDSTFETGSPGSAIQPFRTGGQKIDVLQNESLENQGPFYNELNSIGATAKEQQYLQDYIFNENIRTKSGKFKQPVANAIDSLAKKAEENKSWVSFPEKEYPLFRGENIVEEKTIPQVGDFYFKNRPTSFATSINATNEFMGGLTRPDKQIPGKKVLYAVTEYSDAAKPKLLIPGQETEVIAPSSAKFEVTGRGRLQQNPTLYDPTTDIELIKLKQLYATDPISMGIKGAIDLAKTKPLALAGGAALGALNPDVANAVTQKKYSQAIASIGKDMVAGSAVDSGIRLAGQGLAKIAPQVAAGVNPLVAGAARIAMPAAIGASLLMQGQTNSPLNKIVTAASNTPIGLKVNPTTDIGRNTGRAISNEARYIWEQVLKGKIPYKGF
jgi:hypothetical protein